MPGRTFQPKCSRSVASRASVARKMPGPSVLPKSEEQAFSTIVCHRQAASDAWHRADRVCRHHPSIGAELIRHLGLVPRGEGGPMEGELISDRLDTDLRWIEA